MKRIGFLDGLKGLAILAVVYQHTFATILMSIIGTRLIIGFGYLSVTMFFMISGFLLYLPYASGKKFSYKKKDISSFYVKKIRRLYGPLLFCLFILVVFVHSLSLASLKSALLSITMLSQFVPAQFTPSINGGLWFLPVFVMFILFFPLVLLSIKKVGIIKVLIAVLVLSFFVRLIGAPHYTDNILLSPIKDSIFGRVDDFVVGMFLAHVYVKVANDRFSKLRYLVLAGMAFVFSNIVIMLFLRNNDTRVLIAVSNNFVQVSFALLLLFTACNTHFRKIIENRHLVKVGQMSYSLFLWNIPLIAIILTDHSIKNVCIFILCLVLVSYFSYSRVENYQPNRKLN